MHESGKFHKNDAENSKIQIPNSMDAKNILGFGPPQADCLLELGLMMFLLQQPFFC